MKTKLSYLLLFVVGIFLFDLLFWEQMPGLNLSLFTFYLCFMALAKKRVSELNRNELLALSAVVITSFTSVWHFTSLSIFMLFISFFILIGFLKQPLFQSTLSALAANAIHTIGFPFMAYRSLSNMEQQNSTFRTIGRLIKIALIPLIVFVIFFFIYREANPQFQELTQSLIDFISRLFKDFSFIRFFFLLFGLGWISFAFFPSYFKLKPLLKSEETLHRSKENFNRKAFAANTSLFRSLVSEYKSGIILLSILNALLLVVNIIDIQWIWIDFEVPLEFNLKQFVHEGTYLLIFSILLSIAILLFYFRGSLNFYPKNKWLGVLAKVWISQNLILALSVFLRNYHYIDYHGLAGKRIGVIAFLLMTIFGLLTLWVKVQRKKSFSFLLKINSWFVLFTLVFMSCLHWDRVIVHYNLSHHNPSEIDVDYYLQLDPITAPILLKNLDIIETQMNAHLARENKTRWLTYIEVESFKKQLEYQTSQYLKKKKRFGWPSWNYADFRLSQQIEIIEE